MNKIEFLGTDKEVLDFVGVEAFDYETDNNASVNVRLFGSHGYANVPLGYVFYKDTDEYGTLSIVTDELDSRIEQLEKENAELKEQNRNLLESCEEGATMMYKDLCKAQEIIKDLLDDLTAIDGEGTKELEAVKRAEQFLKGENKMTDKQLEKEADDYADKHAFRVPYDGSNKFYDDVDFKASKEGYLAGAKPREKRIEELEAQIEKMKCCENCGWYYLQQHWRESKEINESRMFHCGTCGNKRNWKVKEIKENDR